MQCSEPVSGTVTDVVVIIKQDVKDRGPEAQNREPTVCLSGPLGQTRAGLELPLDF